MHLARQIYSGESIYFQEVFNEITNQKYGFSIVDLKQRSNNLLRLRTIDFSNGHIYVYVKK